MLDILACPMDKNYPLDLIELHVKEFENDNLREIENDFKFLNIWKNNIPQKILNYANKWHL